MKNWPNMFGQSDDITESVNARFAPIPDLKTARIKFAKACAKSVTEGAIYGLAAVGALAIALQVIHEVKNSK